MHIFKYLVLVSFALSCSLFSQKRSRPNLEGITVKKDIVYENIKGRKLHLDLYTNEKPQAKQPLIIYIHGGAFRAGSKNSGPFLSVIQDLTQKGFAVASINYRLSGEATFPAAVTDCKAAVRFLRANAKKYKLDPNKFGVWGSSAGGYLVSFLGTSGGIKEFEVGSNLDVSSKVQAVCNWFGPTDFLKMNNSPISKMDHNSENSPESMFLGKKITEVPELVKKANPISYISKDDPEFCTLHGEKDVLVIINQSELLHSALKAKGVKSTFHKITNAGHGFKGPEKNQVLKLTVDFFTKNLK